MATGRQFMLTREFSMLPNDVKGYFIRHGLGPNSELRFSPRRKQELYEEHKNTIWTEFALDSAEYDKTIEYLKDALRY